MRISIEWLRAFFLSNSNKPMKLRLLLFLSLMVVLPAFADEANLVIRQKGGSETVLLLSANPVLTFKDEDMIVTSDVSSFIIPLDLIDSYGAANDVTSIHHITQGHPEYKNGSVVFSGLSQGSEVSIYKADGTLVFSHYADASGYAAVSVSNLPKGVYIVRAPNSSIKIINK